MSEENLKNSRTENAHMIFQNWLDATGKSENGHLQEPETSNKSTIVFVAKSHRAYEKANPYVQAVQALLAEYAGIESTIIPGNRSGTKPSLLEVDVNQSDFDQKLDMLNQAAEKLWVNKASLREPRYPRSTPAR